MREGDDVMAKWRDKLTEAENAHIHGYTLHAFKYNRQWQREERERQRRTGFTYTEPCAMCAQIARKLGLEGKP
jgi:hypothetical protein